VILQLLVIIGLNAYLPWRLGALLGLQSKLLLYLLFSFGLVSGIASIFLITRYDNITVMQNDVLFINGIKLVGIRAC